MLIRSMLINMKERLHAQGEIACAFVFVRERERERGSEGEREERGRRRKRQGRGRRREESSINSVLIIICMFSQQLNHQLVITYDIVVCLFLEPWLLQIIRKTLHDIVMGITVTVFVYRSMAPTRLKVEPFTPLCTWTVLYTIVGTQRPFFSSLSSLVPIYAFATHNLPYQCLVSHIDIFQSFYCCTPYGRRLILVPRPSLNGEREKGSGK